MPELWYSGDDSRRRIPEWAAAFVTLGASAAGRYFDDERLVVAVAAPTRAYAGTLAGVGAVAGANATLIRNRDALPQGRSKPTSTYSHHSAQERPSPSGAGRDQERRQRSSVSTTRATEPLIVISQRGFTQMYRKSGCRNISLRGRSLSCLLVGRLNVFEEEMTGR